MLRWAWLVVLCACPQAIKTLPDSDDAGVSPRPDADAGTEIEADAGLWLDAEALPDAEPSDSGPEDTGSFDSGVRPLRWGATPIPGSRTAVSVWFKAPRLLVGTTNGILLSSNNGGPFENIWQDSANAGIRSVRGVGERLFVLTERYFTVLEADTEVYRMYVGDGLADQMVVSADLVYIVGERNFTKMVWRWDGAQVGSGEVLANVAGLYSVDSNGPEVWAGGNGKIFHRDNLGWAEDLILWPVGFTPNQIANFEFQSIRSSNGQQFALGSQHMIFQNTTVGWRLVYGPSGGDVLHALAFGPPGSSVQAVAVGRPGSRGSVVGWSSNEWRSLEVTGNYHLYDVIAVGPDQYVAVGTVGSTFDSVVLRSAP